MDFRHLINTLMVIISNSPNIYKLSHTATCPRPFYITTEHSLYSFIVTSELMENAFKAVHWQLFFCSDNWCIACTSRTGKCHYIVPAYQQQH